MATRSNGTSLLLTLIRCGETTWERDSRVLGATDLPLGEVGREVVEADASRFSPRGGSTVHHPPDDAASATAAIYAAASGLKTKAVAELSDPRLGLLEGLTEQVFAERYPKRYKQWQDDPVSLSPPEGEDLADARARLFAATARLLKRNRGGEVILVLHALSLGFLRCWLAEQPSRELWPMLDTRPRVERYALTGPMIEWLDDAAAAVSGVA